MIPSAPSAAVPDLGPDRDCSLCPRLRGFRDEWRANEPNWWNGPVPSFGSLDSSLLIVGLAPGLRGANRTGRPFTGDWAGDLLYATLLKFGLASGHYDKRPDDGLRVIDTRICNAVRCVPPQNKPTGGEIKTCRPFLEAELAAMPNLRAILCLGRISHEATLRALDLKPSAYRFAHNARHNVRTGLELFDSYHCSRYNTNTGRLTAAMFEEVVAAAAKAANG